MSTPQFSQVVSERLRKSQNPKKEQAIAFDTIDSIKVEDYIYAIATKTAPVNIIGASKITQSRFCCYLNSASLVDELAQDGNNELEICGTKVTIHSYVVRLKRVIFSNVQLCIPNE